MSPRNDLSCLVLQAEGRMERRWERGEWHCWARLGGAGADLEHGRDRGKEQGGSNGIKRRVQQSRDVTKNCKGLNWVEGATWRGNSHPQVCCLRAVAET